jgi:hypothetical protein
LCETAAAQADPCSCNTDWLREETPKLHWSVEFGADDAASMPLAWIVDRVFHLLCVMTAVHPGWDFRRSQLSGERRSNVSGNLERTPGFDLNP